MRGLLRNLSAVVLAAAGLVVSNTAMAASFDTVEDLVRLEAFMDGVIQPLRKNNQSASGVVTIVKGTEVVFAKGYGYHDFEKGMAVDPAKTLFRPGSVSKLFTWVAVMQLYEQGKLDLDADVNQYLETFQIDDTYDNPVTLRHILTHTAGFEDGGLGYLIIEDQDRIISLADAMKRYQPARVNPPGAQTSYSNYATALAGLIVANISGMSFEEYIKVNIFDVLGMNDSTFQEPLPGSMESQMAEGYQVDGGDFVGKPFELISNFGPAGAMSSSGTDMARFAAAILNQGELDSGSILRPETLAEMLTRAFTHHDQMMGMALGFYETEVNGVRLVGHGGDTNHFHSDLAVDLENNLAIYTSFTGNGGSVVRSAIVPAFYAQYFPRKETPPEIPSGFSERAGKYAGNYQFWRNNFSTIEKVGLLIPGYTLTVAPTENDTLLLAFAGGAKQYVEVGDNLFRELNSELALNSRFSPRLIGFQADDSGAITGMVIDGIPFMSMFKSPARTTGQFNIPLLLISTLVFLFVLIRLAYQRSRFQQTQGADRRAVVAAVCVAAANLLFLVVFALVIGVYGEDLFNGIPLAFKLMLILPMVAFVAGLYQVYQTVNVWRGGLLAGAWARLRYTVVTLCALFMCWFYNFWNFLGFNYLG
ncbi:MAG: serine hydrolase domain-containing protein [Xanthomonadales bacterium]|nr:serine hydrolase domain-containing protein [Xanthomonadales bacterium]